LRRFDNFSAGATSLLHYLVDFLATQLLAMRPTKT
jgi:hypothetical protein